MLPLIFEDRIEAAHELARVLEEFRASNPLVLGIPRGAVPMAKIVADHLQADLDIELVHKFGDPGAPEFALGAVTEDGRIVLGVGAEREGLRIDDCRAAAQDEILKLIEKRKRFTPHRSQANPDGRTVILIDDGIATGATVTAAVRALKDRGAKRIVVATPVASKDAVMRLKSEGAEVRVLSVPSPFFSVSQFYRDFTEVTDADVIESLLTSPRRREDPAPTSRA